MSGFGQRMFERTDDQAAHQPGIAKAYFGLGRVNVDVDQFRSKREKQGNHRVTAGGQKVLICAAHGSEKKAVTNRAAIHEQILGGRCSPVECRKTGIAGQMHSLAFGVDDDGIAGELSPENSPQTDKATFGFGRARGW